MQCLHFTDTVTRYMYCNRFKEHCVCLNTAVECLKVCKLALDSPDHVTLCPCGPVEPRVNTVF